MTCVPIDMLPIHSVHCSLLPEQGKSVVVYFTSEHSFKHRPVWHHILLIYKIVIHVSHTYMHFKWNKFTFELESWRNILWCPLRRAFTFEYKKHLKRYEWNVRGARTGIENCWFTHSVSSLGRVYQVVHKNQMSAFEVVGAFFIIHALASRLPPLFYAPATNDVRKASVHYNRLWSFTELIPNRPRLHRDALYKWLISPLLCRVRKLLDLIKNIKICVLKMNISFVVLTGLMCFERHEGE